MHKSLETYVAQSECICIFLIYIKYIYLLLLHLHAYVRYRSMSNIPYSRIRVIYVLRPCALGFGLRSVHDIYS